MANARRLIKLIPPLFDTPYYRKIKHLFGNSIIGYWPLWEFDGAVAYDISGNGRNGAYTGVDLKYPGIGDGHTCPYFDGVSDYVNIYSASLAAAFNGAEGTIIIWSKVFNVGVWTDATTRYVFRFLVNANNFVALYKGGDNNFYWRYSSGGILNQVGLTTTILNFMHMGLTWSKSNDRMRAFFGGSQTGVDQTSLGVWAGSLDVDNSVIGAGDIIPNSPWFGYEGHGIVLNREATPAEIAKAAQL